MATGDSLIVDFLMSLELELEDMGYLTTGQILEQLETGLNKSTQERAQDGPKDNEQEK